MSELAIRYVPGMPWKLVDGVRVPDIDAIRACPFPTPYTVGQFGARPTVACPPDSSETSQEYLEECDINVLMARYQRGIPLPILNTPASYGDVSDVPDYMEALNIVIQAQHDFADLPAKLRERFNHDPGQLLAFLADTANRDEAIKLGLVNAPPAPTSASAPPEAQPNDPTKNPASQRSAAAVGGQGA